MMTQSPPGNVTTTATTTTTPPPESTWNPPPSPSNDKSPPSPVLLPPPQQAPPAPPPSTSPTAPPAPPPIPVSPPPSQPSPKKPSLPPQPSPARPTTPEPPPSSSPPPPSTTPASFPPPPPATSTPSPTPPTPSFPATPTTPLPSLSPPPPPTTPASFPPPPPATSTPSPTPPTPSFPATPTAPLPSFSPPPPTSITQPPPPPAGRSPPSNSSSSHSSTILIPVMVSLVAALVIVGFSFVCCWKKRRRIGGRVTGGDPPATTPGHQKGMATNGIPSGNIPSDNSGSDSYPHAYPGIGFNVSKDTFTFEQLSQATDGFSEANLLGQGGFGYVHKGVLPNGEVAIKQLKAGSGQGEREFHAEVEIISRVHHKHLVSLVGYCITGSRRLLVYEFLPNDTLHYHLHGQGGSVMDWPTRLRIAVGSARGLAYLHEDCYPKIIHRDIKAANILLDFRFEAKVADFGLAKFCSDVNTHVSTRVMGTFGYLAPEYASTGKLTEKSDVYSFGVVLLELITGHKPVDSTENMGKSLVDWARPHFVQAVEDKNFDAIVDPRLLDDYDHDEMFHMVACAAMSVRYSAHRRPRMSHIVRALEGNMPIAELKEETKAAGHSTDGSQGSLSSEYNTGQYQNDLSEFRRITFGSQAYESS